MNHRTTKMVDIYFVALAFHLILVENRGFEPRCILLAKQVSTPSRPIPQKFIRLYTVQESNLLTRPRQEREAITVDICVADALVYRLIKVVWWSE